MRIAIVTEEGYPFVRSEVGDFVEWLLKSFPKFEFDIVAITTASTYVYEVPRNVSFVWVYTLGRQRHYSVRPHLSKRERQLCAHWLSQQNTEQYALRLFANRKRFGTMIPASCLWGAITATYEEGMSFRMYCQQYTGVCHLLLPLLQQRFPQVDLIHTTTTKYGGAVAALMKAQQYVPLVLTEYKQEEEMSLFTHIRRHVYAHADMVITKNERLKTIPSYKQCVFDEALQDSYVRHLYELLYKGVTYES